MRLIDADALMDVIRQHEYSLATKQGSVDYGMFTLGIQQVVDEQPIVDAVEVVHGQWEAAGFDGRGDYKECCSSCKSWSIGEDKLYCPVCGAKMDGDGNG